MVFSCGAKDQPRTSYVARYMLYLLSCLLVHTRASFTEVVLGCIMKSFLNSWGVQWNIRYMNIDCGIYQTLGLWDRFHLCNFALLIWTDAYWKHPSSMFLVPGFIFQLRVGLHTGGIAKLFNILQLGHLLCDIRQVTSPEYFIHLYPLVGIHLTGLIVVLLECIYQYINGRFFTHDI